MKEIGGFFGLEQLPGNEHYANLVGINNATNALLYTLKANAIRKVYIPYYLKHVIRAMCKKHGYDVELYNVDRHFRPVWDKPIGDREVFYIVNHFAQLTNEDVLDLNARHSRIVLDNSQAFFLPPLEGVDTIYSAYKWFGVPDGAYLSTDKHLHPDPELDESRDRMRHVLGRYETTASEFLGVFQELQRSFDDMPLKFMSRLTRNILGAIDYEGVRRKRKENYAFLHSRLGTMNKLDLIAPTGPFAYPFYANNGIEIRRRLAERKIYVPTLWQNVLDQMPRDSVEYDYAANVLPLPCDQRYGLDDMKRVAQEVISGLA